MSAVLPVPLKRLVRHKRVLLLQGPMGPFFRQLAQFLEKHQVEVHKVNFNGGDVLFSKGINAKAFTQPLSELHQWLSAHAKQLKIQAFVLFGQTRPIHQVAIEVAKELGIALHIFEEGYIRPDYITLEEGGVNAHSQLPRNPKAYGAPVEPPLTTAEPTQQRFRRMAIYASLYAIAKWAAKPFFAHEVYHRPLNPITQAYQWAIIGSYRKLYFKFKERSLLGELTNKKRTKRFFLLPLQVHNDCQMTHYSNYASVDIVIKEVITSFKNNAKKTDWLVIKHHPLDRPYREYSAYIQSLANELGIQNRVLAVHDLHLPTLIKNSKGVICVNSTTGLQALGHKTPVVTLSEDCFYNIPHLIQGTAKNLDTFWKKPGRVNTTLYQNFRHYLIKETQLNASFYAKQPCFNSAEIAIECQNNIKNKEINSTNGSTAMPTV